MDDVFDHRHPYQDELGLSESQFGLMVALPILTGSLVRLPLGLITDRFGGRIVFFIHMLLVAIPIYGLAFASQYWHYLVLGLFVGLAGGSFAVGIAYTSAWFEKERQGTAMGIFGAGNAGAAITNLVAPMIVVAFGWRMVPQVYSVAMLVTAVLFWLFTWTDPAHLRVPSRPASGRPWPSNWRRSPSCASGASACTTSSSSAASSPWPCGCRSTTSPNTAWT